MIPTSATSTLTPHRRPPCPRGPSNFDDHDTYDPTLLYLHETALTAMEDHQPYDQLVRFLHETAFPDASSLRLVDVVRPPGGMSWESFFITLALRRNREESPVRIVVKRAPGEWGPLGRFDASKDAAIFGSLHGHVPVPRLVAWTADPAVFVRPFTATEMVEGESDDLYRVDRWPLWQTHRRELGHGILATLAALQRFRWQGTELVEVLGPRGSAAERLRAMVDWYLRPYLVRRQTVTAAQVFWHDVGRWLVDNVADLPEEDLVVVHGDFRFGNMIWQGTSVAAVVDWERASLGDPMSDLGFLSVPMARRRHPELLGMALPYDELVEGYVTATGRPFDPRRFQFYVIFWQFIEGSLMSRPAEDAGDHRTTRTGGTEVAARRAGVGSLPLGPNLHVRQIAPVIEAYESGRHDVV